MRKPIHFQANGTGILVLANDGTWWHRPHVISDDNEWEQRNFGQLPQPAKRKPKSWQAPTVEDVRELITRKGYKVDPVTFHAHYTQNGWRVGRAGLPMKSWQAAVALWARRPGFADNDKQGPNVRGLEPECRGCGKMARHWRTDGAGFCDASMECGS